jgi:hypothetical protein
MISLLNAIVTVLFRALEGIIGFLQDLIPLIFKIVFSLSPFLLMIAVSYKLWGLRTGIGVGIGVVILMIIGLVYAFSNNIQGSTLSETVVVIVIIMDLLLGGVIVWKVYYANRSSNQPVADNSQNISGQSQEVKKTKEELLLNLLKQAIESKNTDEITRSIEELRKIKSNAAIPLIKEVLTAYYLDAHNDYNPNTDYKVSELCINTLVELNAKDSCNLLVEVGVKNPYLTKIAEQATTQICN